VLTWRFGRAGNCERDGRPACLSLPLIRVREFNHTILTNRRLTVRLGVSIAIGSGGKKQGPPTDTAYSAARDGTFFMRCKAFDDPQAVKIQ
jgi:hypothetical protein